MGLLEGGSYACVVPQCWVPRDQACTWVPVAAGPHRKADHVEPDEGEREHWYRADRVASDAACEFSVGSVLREQVCSLLCSSRNLQGLSWWVCAPQADDKRWVWKVAFTNSFLLVRLFNYGGARNWQTKPPDQARRFQRMGRPDTAPRWMLRTNDPIRTHSHTNAKVTL